MYMSPCSSNRQSHVLGRMERPRGVCRCFATAASAIRLVTLMMAASGSVASPSSASPRGFPPVSTNRCSDLDLSGLTNAMNCGSPLSSPCFDFTRCRNAPPTVYIYDQKVSDAEIFLLLRWQPSGRALPPAGLAVRGCSAVSLCTHTVFRFLALSSCTC